jgi:hypothetical protein
MSVEIAGPKRSSRQRQASSKVRVFDEHTRSEIKRKKLAALEQDNWVEEKRGKEEEEEDEDYNMDASSGDGMWHARSIQRHIPPTTLPSPKRKPSRRSRLFAICRGGRRCEQATKEEEEGQKEGHLECDAKVQVSAGPPQKCTPLP